MSQIQDLDFSSDLLRALLWQHNTAARTEALVRAKNAWYEENQRDFWTNWVKDVFDLRTANAFGLQVWSRILGVPLQVAITPTTRLKPAFGFGSFNSNFNNSNFTNNNGGTAGLTVEQQRILLRLRYYQLISRCTVPDINRICAAVFADLGTVYVLDGNDMEFTIYVFDFSPGSQLQFLLEQYDLLPRPAGVGVKYNIVTRPVFGFGPFNKNFNNGTFAKDTN